MMLWSVIIVPDLVSCYPNRETYMPPTSNREREAEPIHSPSRHAENEISLAISTRPQTVQ
jgi:hypothetical protein